MSENDETPNGTPCRWCGWTTRPKITVSGAGFRLLACPECEGYVDSKCVFRTFDGKKLTLVFNKTGTLLLEVETGDSYAKAIAAIGSETSAKRKPRRFQ